MNPEHVKVLVTRRMQQAAECLEDGRYLLSAGRGARTAVNRAYYAAFYAVLAWAGVQENRRSMESKLAPGGKLEAEKVRGAPSGLLPEMVKLKVWPSLTVWSPMGSRMGPGLEPVAKLQILWKQLI